MTNAQKEAKREYPIYDKHAEQIMMDREAYIKGYERAIANAARWLKKNNVRYPNDSIETSTLVENFKTETK